ncbi:hypothetical protein EV421DRAFT_1909861 [Armillaria borealis]|uniref:Uncharacterized protein n=1 Tax=Armillaria borealis TaxID=47425 RepID=A0AA39J031_9AGAR|nr:hypothetical protein EV421DRAFT_1909861 [Armillaria borealis]
MSHTDRLEHAFSSQPQPLHGKAGWSLGNTWIPPDNSELSLDMDGRDYKDQMNAEVFESSIFQDNTAEVQWSSRLKVSRQPHLVWKEQFRSLYLDEITRHDRQGDSHQNLKCLDCIARNLEEAA